MLAESGTMDSGPRCKLRDRHSFHLWLFSIDGGGTRKRREDTWVRPQNLSKAIEKGLERRRPIGGVKWLLHRMRLSQRLEKWVRKIRLPSGGPRPGRKRTKRHILLSPGDSAPR